LEGTPHLKYEAITNEAHSQRTAFTESLVLVSRRV